MVVCRYIETLRIFPVSCVLPSMCFELANAAENVCHEVVLSGTSV